MKFISASAILASLASTAFAGPLEDFTLGESATIEYDVATNVFTLDWADGTDQTVAAFSYEYFSFDCETTSYGDGIASGLTGSVFTNDSGGVIGNPYMTFQVALGAVAGTGMYSINAAGTDAAITFCVRNKLSTQDGIEVNFQESQITLNINLEAGVATSVGVVERTRNADTKAEQQYSILTTLCGTTENPAPQGSLVTVCMEPDSSDVKIASLLDFIWEQKNAAPEPEVIQQQSAISLDAAANALSTACDCPSVKPTSGATCQFSSVLKADFYQQTAFAVAGTGNALLELNRRRLNADNMEEEEARLLQDLGSEVTVAVPLASADNGPGALKTAGGASFGISALASGVALLSAALLA
jgi:hypothetical protein